VVPPPGEAVRFLDEPAKPPEPIPPSQTDVEYELIREAQKAIGTSPVIGAVSRGEAVPSSGMPAARSDVSSPKPSPEKALLVSSGDIGRPYEVIKLVTAYASSDEGFSGRISGGEAYEAAIRRLEQAASRLEADALIYVNLHGNMGVKRAFVGEVHMYEVFAWGTAVRFRS